MHFETKLAGLVYMRLFSDSGDHPKITNARVVAAVGVQYGRQSYDSPSASKVTLKHMGNASRDW